MGCKRNESFRAIAAIPIVAIRQQRTIQRTNSAEYQRHPLMIRFPVNRY
jgi:hypothetical protein